MREFPLVFETVDPQGRRVGLNEEAWRHIQERHGSALTPALIKATIENPDRIVKDPGNESLNYQFRKEVRFYRVACVKEYSDRDPPFQVSTAYPTAIPRDGERVWQRPVKP